MVRKLNESIYDSQQELLKTINNVEIVCNKLINALTATKSNYANRINEVIAHLDDVDESEQKEMVFQELNGNYGRLLHELNKADMSIKKALSYISDSDYYVDWTDREDNE